MSCEVVGLFFFFFELPTFEGAQVEVFLFHELRNTLTVLASGAERLEKRRLKTGLANKPRSNQTRVVGGRGAQPGHKMSSHVCE